jgi:hypothetical protein
MDVEMDEEEKALSDLRKLVWKVAFLKIGAQDFYLKIFIGVESNRSMH